MSELDTVRQYEENNYAWAKDRLGTATELIQGLVDLYDVMADLARSGPAKLGPEDLMSVALLLTCRYELGMAGLDILRTHRLASYQHTRRAIETCAFARRIKNDPALITLWSNAGDDELAYDAYRKQFTSVQTFPKSHKLLSVLYEHYELCSRRSHPSVLSVGLQTTIAKTGETTTIEVGYTSSWTPRTRSSR
jgi:hypothetical protein